MDLGSLDLGIVRPLVGFPWYGIASAKGVLLHQPALPGCVTRLPVFSQTLITPDLSVHDPFDEIRSPPDAP